MLYWGQTDPAQKGGTTMPESIPLPALDAETGSLLRPEDIAFFES